MRKEISIIIPSYNRYPQNLLTLYSLQNQTYDPDKFEVIFIDDCSSDKTPIIQHTFQPPFSFNYIRNEENLGRSKSRNLGINEATGRIIIFLDAEMIVEPDFVQNHANHHDTESNKVVSGALFLKRVYTISNKLFTKQQRLHMDYLLKMNRKIFKIKRSQIRRGYPEVQFITKEDILNGHYKLLSYDSPYFQDVKNHYGAELNGHHLPWILFISGIVSVPKQLLLKSGGFDESFVGWGFEDWELGYRLYQNGAEFISASDVTGYHQEHPISVIDIDQSMFENYLRYQRKHPNYETCIHTLFLMGEITRVEESIIVGEYKSLLCEHPDRFNQFKEGYLALLQQCAVLLSENKAIEDLWIGMDLKDPTSLKELIRSERDEVASLNQYPQLIRSMNILLEK
ncbi:glycosyltransferase family 2 protein [Pseudalkalibacillus sp. SCS-8]|uniref:glycosyltransferase family 2 protein n=1 Tax=Pseudalkalibacillus nanhaiensis TaxID=3115291 RepID=UPI0032DB2292